MIKLIRLNDFLALNVCRVVPFNPYAQILPTLGFVYFTLRFIPFFFNHTGIRGKRYICETWRVESAELKHRGRIGTTLQILRVKRSLSLNTN